MAQSEPNLPKKRRVRGALLTPEHAAQLRHLVAERPDAHLKDLARAMDWIVGPATIRTWCKKLGLSYRRGNPGTSKLTPKIGKRLCALIARQPSAYLREVAQAMGNVVSITTIATWCRKLGLPHRQSPGIRSTITPEIESRLRTLLAEQPSPYFRELNQAIGKNVHRRTLRKWCIKLGLPYVPCNGKRRTRTSQMEARLRALVAERPLSNYTELAEVLQVHASTVADWARQLGLPHQRPVFRRQRLTPEIKAQLQSLVAERPSATYKELAEVLKRSTATIKRWVKRLALPHHDGRR